MLEIGGWRRIVTVVRLSLHVGKGEGWEVRVVGEV